MTQLYRVTARCRVRRGSRLQAASWRAGLSLACAVAKRRRGRGNGGGRSDRASARFHALWRGAGWHGVAMAGGLRVLCKRRD